MIVAPHPLETATAAVVQEHSKLLKDIQELKGALNASYEREAILKGRIEALDKELSDTKDKSDHYLRWNVELSKQMHNIGMFVQEAMQIARVEVNKSKSKDMSATLQAVEQAIIENKS
jgi:hypothetical protein